MPTLTLVPSGSVSTGVGSADSTICRAVLSPFDSRLNLRRVEARFVQRLHRPFRTLLVAEDADQYLCTIDLSFDKLPPMSCHRRTPADHPRASPP